MNNFLFHHGVKGQHWGVRRYQNYDGTLTEEGKAHYYLDKTYDHFQMWAKSDNEKAWNKFIKIRRKQAKAAEKGQN